MPEFWELLATARDVLAVILVVLSLLVMTIAVIGLVRLREPIMKLHATSKAVVLGNVSLLLATMTTGDVALMTRAVLIILFLLVTTPVAAHVLARAMYRAPGVARGQGQERQLEPRQEREQE